MLTARSQILQDIRRTLSVDSPLPELAGPWTCYAAPHEQFLETLRGVGGVGKLLANAAELRQEVAALIAQLGAQKICSALSEVVAGNVDMAAIDDPHQLADVDLAILPGDLAVAENAAVWITGDCVRHRVAYFLSQHVALVVPRDQIVSNMHEAYEWLYREGGAGPFREPKWGAFMSGPSKTADIEQALVIGAHGARSLHVFFA